MMRLFSLFLFTLLFMAVTFSSAVATTADRGVIRKVSSSCARQGLVIGNSDYADTPLANPVHDARDMAAALKNLGFCVTPLYNADRQQMIQAINSFAEHLKSAEAGFFFYAGHGMQSGGLNYLIPVDASLASESDVEFEAVAAERLIGKMKEAGNPLNVVVLDACRNNPFKRSSRSASKGLTSMNAPVGTIIAYATALGEVALDGSGRNGLYTGCLLDVLARDRVNIRNVFNDAGLLVVKKTGAKQVPWVSSSPVPDFYLRGKGQSGASLLPPSSTPIKMGVKTDWQEKKTGMEFVKIPEGCFQRGSPGSEEGSQENERPRKKICLSAFYMGRYEVTQDEYRRITGKSPSKFGDGSRWPVEQVSYEDTKEFLRLLNAGGRSKNGKLFRLPTEAEWEYAARAGSEGACAFGQKITERMANFNSPGKRLAQRRPLQVGSYPANAFGLYDMHGNLWEWCSDYFSPHYYRSSPQKNPPGPVQGEGHIARGGSWSSRADSLRSARRFWFAPETRSASLGFRVVFSADINSSEQQQ